MQKMHNFQLQVPVLILPRVRYAASNDTFTKYNMNHINLSIVANEPIWYCLGMMPSIGSHQSQLSLPPSTNAILGCYNRGLYVDQSVHVKTNHHFL